MLFFFQRKNMLKKKAVSPKSHSASQHIHTHVYFVHIFELIDGSFITCNSNLVPLLEVYVAQIHVDLSSRFLEFLPELCTHIRIHTCGDLVHLDSSGPPGVSSRPLGSHQSTPSVQCVCVCVYTPIHLRTLPPALKTEKTQTTLTSFLLSKIIPHAKQQVPS